MSSHDNDAYDDFRSFFKLSNPLLFDSMIAAVLYLGYRMSLRKFPKIAKLFNEAAVIFLVFFLYDMGRFLALDSEYQAMINARKVIHFEKVIGIGFEAKLQAFFLQRSPMFVQFMNSFYLIAHWGSIVVFFGWAIFRSRSNVDRHALYVTARTRFVVMNLLASISFMTFPCAPPRAVPDGGYVDTLQILSNTDLYTSTRRFVNPYAAMPSMHIGYSLFFSLITIIFLRAEFKLNERNCSRRQNFISYLPFLFIAYPVFMVVVIVATGNHFMLDAIAGAITCGLAFVVCEILTRAWVRIKAAREVYYGKHPRYAHLADEEFSTDLDIELGLPTTYKDTSSMEPSISSALTSE